MFLLRQQRQRRRWTQHHWPQLQPDTESDRDKYTFRFDVEASSRNSFFSVIDRGTEINQRPDVDNGRVQYYSFGFQGSDRQSAVFSWRWSPTNSLTNEVRGGWFFSLPIFDRTNLQDATSF